MIDPIEDKSRPLYGFYRAQVVINEDPTAKARVKVWIPDLMPLVPKTSGLWAVPANQAVGGRNLENKTTYYAGQCLIPTVGSYVWIFFENGNPNRPFYMGALNLSNSSALPECRTGKNKSDKWVIFKSVKGRCIVISDDPDDCRVEITGAKKGIGSPPDGDTASVFTIDGNQTTILLDERAGQEKLLIRSREGDSLLIDLKKRRFTVKVKNEIMIMCEKDINLICDNMNIITKGNYTLNTVKDINFTASNMITQTGKGISTQSIGSISLTGTKLEIFAPQVQTDGGMSKIGCGAVQPTTVVP